MLSEVIFVHFSFLSASFADVLTKVAATASPPNTRGYSSEWQFRENFLDTALSYDASPKTSTTTEKLIQYASGWRPIPSTRNALRDREARSGTQHYGPVVQIGGHRDKPQPFKPWKRTPNRVHEYSSSLSHTRNKPFPFSYVSSMIPNATNILPQIRHNSYPIDRTTNTVDRFRPPSFRPQYDLDMRKKKSKPAPVMKEDDIVWMHYNSFDHHLPKALPFMSNELTPEVRQIDQYDSGDMMMQETRDDTSPFVVYSSSTGIAEPMQPSTEEDVITSTTLTTPRPYQSRNSYEIIDKNNKDNFKPMTTTQRVLEEGTTQIEADTDEEDESWPNFHDMFYGAPEGSTNEPATEYNNLVPVQVSSAAPSTAGTQQTLREQQEDSESKRNRRLFNVTKSENILSQEFVKSTSDQPIKVLDDQSTKKSTTTTKYFAKPIVITDSPPPENEYFKQLWYNNVGDGGSNDRQQRRNVDENANDENEIKDNSTETLDERTDNEVSSEDEPTVKLTAPEMKSQQRRPAGNFSGGGGGGGAENDDYKVDEVVVKKRVRASDETWNFLLNMTEGVQFADLIPVTLKTNMFLVKKLIVECYSDGDETDSRGSTVNCLKKITFKVLDRAVESDVVKITDSVSLVRDNNTAVDRFSSSRSFSDDSDWLSSFLEKVQKLFSTHSLKVKLVNPRETENFQVEGRRRHRFRRVFPVVAGIYMTITAVVIPIVFQFMAMMGGKSFVISKLALLFALFSSFSKFFTQPADNNAHQQQHHHQSLPLPPPLPPLPPIPYPHYNYDHAAAAKRKSDKRFKRIPVDYNYSYYLTD